MSRFWRSPIGLLSGSMRRPFHAKPSWRVSPYAMANLVAPFSCVIADEKISEIAGVELTHLIAGASFTKSSWRCSTGFAEGGRSERDLRDERGGLFHTWDRRGTGHRPKHGPAVSEITRCHEAEASPAANIEARRLYGIRRPAGVGGAGKLRGPAPGAQGPGL